MFWKFSRLHSAVCEFALVIFTLEPQDFLLYMFRIVFRSYLYKPSWKSEGLLNSSDWKSERETRSNAKYPYVVVWNNQQSGFL
jgi:hypothetical protein